MFAIIDVEGKSDRRQGETMHFENPLETIELHSLSYINLNPDEAEIESNVKCYTYIV